MLSYQDQLSAISARHYAADCAAYFEEDKQAAFVTAMDELGALRSKYFSLSELVFFLDVRPSEVAQWRRSDLTFPAADLDEGKTEIFLRSEIEMWLCIHADTANGGDQSELG